MPRRNRFRGVLQPRQVGLPRGESPVLLLYDIEDNRIRTRVSEVCLDFGLERIQFSAFLGRLTRDRREALGLRLLREIERENCRVRVIPLTEECLEAAWEYDWWRKDADELKARAPETPEDGIPKLKIIRVEED